MVNTNTAQDFLTVSQLNNFIKDVINAGFPQTVWVCGEIQGYDRNRTKNHIFFELIEKDYKSSEVLARAGLVIFANRKFVIENILKENENGFTLKDDIEVKFECRVDFYPPHGAVRLIVENIDPFYTLGKLAQEKQKLIAALKEKGILDRNKSAELPLVPLKVGLITSDDSAAYNDFISELKRSGLGFKVYLRNTLMQGKKAEKDTCDALDELVPFAPDVVVITRGGGSLAELSCFDSEKIAKKIAEFPIPVLSGIGHEINTTITDLAAHTYAKTPTAIAQFLVERTNAFLELIQNSLETVVSAAENKIGEENQKLKDCANVLQNRTLAFLDEHNEMIVRFAEILRQAPAVRIKEQFRDLGQYSDSLDRSVRTRIQNEYSKLNSCEKIIAMAHPQNTMRRGFSIVRNKNGKVIRKVSEAKVGEELITEFMDGKVESRVLKSIKEKGNGTGSV